MQQASKAPAKSNGLILWEGASPLDNAPIAVIAIGLASGSTNSKTGNLLQTYIIRTDVSPIEAVKAGLDASICGDCKHGPGSPYALRSCYVNLGQGPRAVFDGYQRGIYPRADLCADITAAGRGRKVRLGTYGDPAMVPLWVWNALLQDAIGHTGYTHQWRAHWAQDMRGIVMASADTDAEGNQARAMGWRTFRVRTDAQQVNPGEFTCPASKEAGYRKTCATCLACDGAQRGPKQASPVIIVHGSLAKRFAQRMQAGQ